MRINTILIGLFTMIFTGCSGTMTLLYCGDGELDPGEECDDGNRMDGDGCNARCKWEDDADGGPGPDLDGDGDTDADGDTDTDADSDIDTGLPPCSGANTCMTNAQCRNAGGIQITSQECADSSKVCCYVPDPEDSDTVPVCTPDDYEPNDSLNKAFELLPWVYFEAVVCPEDHDFYTVYLEEGDVLFVNILFDNASGDLDLALYDDANNRVALSETISDDEAFEYTAPDAGYYYIEVYAWMDDWNVYTMNVTLEENTTPTDIPTDIPTDTDVAPTCPSDDEYEQNDSLAEAYGLAAPADIEAVVCTGDADFYAIPLNRGDYVDISLQFIDNQGDLDMRLRAPNSDVLSISESITDNEAIRYTAETSGVHTVEIYGWQDAQNLYQLRVEVTGEDGGTETETDTLDIDGGTDTGPALTCPEDDALENNDSISDPTAIDAPFTADAIVCRGDNDYFGIPLRIGQEIEINIYFIDELGDVDLGLYDPEGDVLTVSQSVSDNERIVFTATETGTHYIRVYGWQNAENTYTIDVAVQDTETDTSPTCPLDDMWEDNDTRQTATVIPSPYAEYAIVCSGDEDWYAIDLEEDAEINIDLLFQHADGNLDLMLTNPTAGFTLLQESLTNNEQISAQVTAAGTYWIRVAGATSSDESPYMLQVTATGGSSMDAGL